MQGSDQRNLPLITSLVLGCIVALVIGLTDKLLFDQFNLIRTILIGVIVIAISFFLIRFVINSFIYSKVKLIYKTINNLKTPSTELKNSLQTKDDTLESVNADVVSWAETKQQEIELLKDQEIYRREFLGNVSHELKTPIFNIQGYVHTLLDGGLEDEEINRKFLIRADNSVERMISVVQDLETISKLESGRLQLQIDRINISELVKEIIEIEEMKAAKKGLVLSLAAKFDRPLYVMADADQIKHVYINLVDNAIKYSKKNGSVRFRFYDMDQNVLCEVADDGAGIAKHHVPRLFERFYRVDAARDRNAGGTGLGLSIVKHIIDAHQQTINVRTQIGTNSGTTFSFTLKKA